MSNKDLAKWDSFEALEECIRRDSHTVAKALGMHPSTVQKWKEEPRTDEDFEKSGARNPLDRIQIIIDAIEKKDPARAHLPILWLCAQNGLSKPFRLPRVTSNSGINKALLAWTKEFGETCQKVSAALEDEKVDKSEYKEIHREMMEDIESGMALLEALKQVAERE